jgi:hypothetical protein
VTSSRNPTIEAAVPWGEIGNQLETTRRSRIQKYRVSNQQTMPPMSGLTPRQFEQSKDGLVLHGLTHGSLDAAGSAGVVGILETETIGG